MSIKKCDECGCPQVDDYDINYFSVELHYKKCSRVRDPTWTWNSGRRKIYLKSNFKRLMKSLRANVAYAKEQIVELQDCIKNTCLDEVYECRWDCCIVLG